MLEGVLIASFIRLYLGAGRLWLLWLICGLRALMLVLNFVAGPNFYYREITDLHRTPLLGELISRPHGVLHPWVILMPLSFVLIIVFAIDAAHTASKRSGRRRAWVLGGLLAVGFSVGLVSYALYAREILPSTFSSQLVLSLVILMGYELSVDVLRAGQLSRELVESQQRMRQAASAADLSLWEWDIVRDKIWVTEKGLERAGVTASERIDFDRFLQAIHPDDREPTQRAVRHSLEGRGEFEAEYRVTARDDATRWVVARGQVERDTDGKPLRLRGVSVDITQRKQAEAEAQRQRAELAHVARVSTMGELAASVAHELNQPLGAILANAEAADLFINQNPPALDEVRAILIDIRKDDERASEVIRRMRALLRKRELDRQPLEINSVVEDVLQVVSGDAALRKMTIHADLAPSLPKILGDRVHLQQVLLNLVLNGMDAMADQPHERRKLSIRTRSGAEGIVEVTVMDLGHGIEAEKLPRLFEPFYTSKPNGMGMGLSISRTIIEAHRGHIWAENNPSGGATFRVALPSSGEGKK
jgi:PAS domain S-box-containing protein